MYGAAQPRVHRDRAEGSGTSCLKHYILSSLLTLHEALRDKLKAHLLDSKLTLLLPEAPHCSLTVYINAPSLTALLSMTQVDATRHSSYWNVTRTLYMKSLLSLKCAQSSLKCTNCSFSFLNVSGGQLRRNPWLHRSSHFSLVSLPPSFSPCSSCSGRRSRPSSAPVG